MSDQGGGAGAGGDQGDDDNGTPESHGVYGGTVRGDGKMQEEPSGADGADEAEWASRTESGGDAT